MNLTAKWIWTETDKARYNHTIHARKSFRLNAGCLSSAQMYITADSWYRLYINSEWVNDGPCRSWPEHYQMDTLDVSSFLREGENTIEITARYFGCGTFHQVPQHPGLLVQLNMKEANGSTTCIVSDSSWETTELPEHVANTPKISCQMEPYETYDASKTGQRSYQPAHVFFDTNDGPWKDLQTRDCPLLTKTPRALSRFVSAQMIDNDWNSWSFGIGRTLHPGLIESNNITSMACALATVIEVQDTCEITIEPWLLAIAINGKRIRPGSKICLNPGQYLLVAVVTDIFNHWARDVGVRFHGMPSREKAHLVNPCDSGAENPWLFFPFPDLRFVDDDLVWQGFPEESRDVYKKKATETLERLLDEAVDVQTLKEKYGNQVVTLPADQLLQEDPYARFQARKVLGDISSQIQNPAALMFDNAEVTIVQLSNKGDTELLYDLGEQVCGYYNFDIIAPDNFEMDIHGLEYITPDGTLQHTAPYRNGMSFRCNKAGVYRYTSLKRRSQRYLFITLRSNGNGGTVQLRKMQVIESTYPVNAIGSFTCSDADLGSIWNISARTLQLCMEDTFTDCPLYEQTLWVGDARNEAIFAFTAFGAEDLARRCIRLAAQSLDRYPIVGCQVPSSWDVLLPAWSFLWGISIWDYYFYTKDEVLVEEMWPCILKNLENAFTMVDDRGLFSAPYWNMFDWAGIDQDHQTVLHNTMFLIGAIDAAMKCADVLGDSTSRVRLDKMHKQFIQNVNIMWDDSRATYPDSIHEDGKISQSTSQHTSFLALLYNIIPEQHRKAALRNTLEPPAGMVQVGSPFAVMYLYEALEHVGAEDRILDMIRENYLPMLEAGATTVWETFSTGLSGWGDFPTRSHCHAWSSAPIHFLNRIVLGIKQTKPGGDTFSISPRPNGLIWAKGTSASHQGPVTVHWRIQDTVMDIRAQAPDGVTLVYTHNDALEGMKVLFNGIEQT